MTKDPVLDKGTFEIGGTYVGAALTTIGDEPLIPLEQKTFVSGQNESMNTSGLTLLCFEVTNTHATTALGDFALLATAHKNGDGVTLISGSTWGTVAGILKHKVGSLNTLAAGATGFAYVDIGPVYGIRFQAKSGGSSVLANGTFTGNANSWTLGTGWAYGTNNVAATAASATLKQEKANMSTPWTDAERYEVTYTISNYSAGTLSVGTNADPAQASASADGTYSQIIESDAHADGLVFTGAGFSGTIDSISMVSSPAVVVSGSLFR